MGDFHRERCKTDDTNAHINYNMILTLRLALYVAACLKRGLFPIRSWSFTDCFYVVLLFSCGGVGRTYNLRF